MYQEKRIHNFPDYSITSTGQVISYKKEQPIVLKTWQQKSGYENIKLSKGGSTFHFLIHRLVAEHFIPNPDNLPQVNHINKIRNDNRVENLEWCTAKDNLYDSYSTLGPTRNYIECFLQTENGVCLQEFLSIKEACRYAAKTYGCSPTSLEKYHRSRGIVLKLKV